MKRYTLAVFIGRFQPFHNGHMYSLKKCSEIADHIIVGIGSSNVSRTDDNPWTFVERRRMVMAAIREGTDLLSGVSRKVEVVPVPDTPNDEEWVEGVEDLLEQTAIGKQEIVFVSNNEWVTSLMKKAGYAVYETGLFNRDELEGVKIRALMRKGDENWKKRVPEMVSQLISESVNWQISKSASQ